MKFNLILGPSGSGKTSEIFCRVKSLLEKGRTMSGEIGKKIIILVPDQYTVSTERFYLNALGAEAMPFLKILSMKRLASFVFTEYGVGKNGFISGGGRNALMMKSIHSVSDHFEYYPAERISPRFIALMSTAIADLKQSLVTPKEFRAAAEEEKEPKLLDISLCYEAYSAFTERGSFDDADILSVFAELISSKRLFCGTSVFCESFKMFTPQELKVLDAFMLSGANVTVSLPSESRSESKLSLFSAAGECVRKLLGSASRHDIKPEILVLNKNSRFVSKEIDFLQRNFFRDEKTVYADSISDISLYKANDFYDEADFVASKIKEFVSEKGYNYGDIMVIARDMEMYSSVLEPVFDRYNIPLFYHKKTALKKKSVILFIRTLFDILINNITRESVLTLMKTGITGLSVEEISLFENYTVQWSISYDRLLRDFTFSVRGFSETSDSDEDKALLERINTVRRRIVDLIDFFKEEIKKFDSTVLGYSTALYNLFMYMELPSKLEALESEYREYGEEELASEQKQVYELVIDSLDEFVLTSGEDKVSAEEYSEIFMSVIESRNIGIIPVFSNAVVAGRAETTPYNSPKIMFVIGLMNGVFPKNDSAVSILDNKDKLTLEKYNISVGRSDTEKVLFERFLAYYAVSAPSEKLLLSYNVGGAASVPSSVITEIKGLFPMLSENSYPAASDAEGILSRMRNIDSAYELCKKYGITSLDNYFAEKGFGGSSEILPTELSSEKAEALFGKNQTLSASRVANFYKCRFGYFFRYGMNLQKQRLAKLDAIETGNFIHAALKYVFDNGGAGSDETLLASLNTFSEIYLKNLFGEESPGVGQCKHFEELVRRIFRLLKMFREELEKTRFEPFEYELEVSYDSGVRPVHIPYDGGYVTMVGKIDRVDVYERDGKKFVRVIDYKSGSKSFSIEDLYYGLDIQMLVYLYALSENGASLFGSNPIPAGCMYVNANPSTVSIKRNENMSDAEREMENNHKRSGLFLNDPDVLRAMDPERRGKYIPVKENDLKSLATVEEFGKLYSRVRTLLRTVAEETTGGRIYKNPVINSKVDSCKYCDYSKYCERSGCERGLNKVTYDNVYDLIDKEGKRIE